jgi:hypothetical protein
VFKLAAFSADRTFNPSYLRVELGGHAPTSITALSNGRNLGAIKLNKISGNHHHGFDGGSKNQQSAEQLHALCFIISENKLAGTHLHV